MLIDDLDDGFYEARNGGAECQRCERVLVLGKGEVVGVFTVGVTSTKSHFRYM